MTKAALPLALCAALAACGSERAPNSSPPPGVTPEFAQVTANAEGHTVVAQVNGRPVFAACVKLQAQAHGLDKRAALDQCIDFELLAQEAERRGFGESEELAEVRKRESVRAMISEVFLPRFNSPEDVPMADLEAFWKRDIVYNRYNHEEYRFVEYAQFQFPGYKERQIAPPGSEGDVKARAAAEQFYQLVRDLPDLARDDFYRPLASIPADHPDVKFAHPRKPYNTTRHGRAVEQFAAAAFDLEIGKIHPPVRSQFGYFVIMLTGIEPARRTSLEEALPELRQVLYEPSQSQAYLKWNDNITGEHEVARDDELLGDVVVQDPDLGALPPALHP